MAIGGTRRRGVGMSSEGAGPAGGPAPAEVDTASTPGSGQAQLLAQLSPAPIFVIDGGVLTFVNDACASLLGYTPEEMISLGLSAIPHPQDVAQIMRAMTIPLSPTGPARSYVVRLLTRDGDVRWCAAHVAGAEVEGARLNIGTLIDITERLEAEERLAESERRWRALVESAPSLICMVDPEGTILNLNRVPGGGDVQAMIGRKMYDFLAAESHDQFRRALAEVVATGKTVGFEHQGTRASGESTWFANNLGPVVEDGRVVAVTIVSNDVGERKAVEAALRAADARLRALVETAPSVILMLDRDARIVGLNRAEAPNSVDDIIGRDALTHISPEYHAKVREAVARVFETGQRVVLEVEGVHSSGEKAWYTAHLGPVVADGRVTAVTVVATDTTERKAMEQALQESEARLRALFRTAPSFICTVDRDGRFLSLNRVLPELTESEVVGRSLFEFVEPEFHGDLQEALRTVFEEARQTTYECRGLGPDGRSVWYANAAGPLIEDGRVTSAIVVSNDVNAQREMQAELEALREQVESRVATRFGKDNRYQLSFRETMVLTLVAEGRSDRQIAETLCISPGTVNKHVSNAVRKMNVSNRTEAAARAVREGLI